MAIHIVIPARYESTRLPGKPLLDIAGKPMIQHVYERAAQAKVDSVIIATDDPRIVDCGKNFGAKVCLTAKLHQSGTERIAEVIEQLGFAKEDVIVNIQSDEPLIPPSIIDQVANNLMQHQSFPMTTLCESIMHFDDVFDPNITKVIMNAQNRAIYFSRAPIPWYRDGFNSGGKRVPDHFTYHRHIGIYAYQASFVKRYVAWEPSPLERLESLEQLRVLWYGESIHVDIAKESPGPGVDTKDDLELVRSKF